MNAIKVSKQLEDVDAELEELESRLQIAREKKAALAREREQQEKFRQQELQRQSKYAGDADALQRQIEELKQQLALQEIEIKKSSIKTNASVKQQSQSPPIEEVQFQCEYNDIVRGLSEQAKQKHSWEKPAWALPSEAIPEDSILKDSIQNPLLKAPASLGYERKVHEANLALIPGKFVQPTKAKVIEPRMVWIVVNIDGSKVGKIVMHLYGNFIPLTDIFTELKGLELFRCDNNTLVIADIDPNFYVHSGNASSFAKKYSKQANDCCYGIVLEGKDILEQIFHAPSDAVLTVKQSHIFPVKKTK